MTTPALKQVSSDQAALSGDLTLHTVTSVISEGEQAIGKATKEWTLDLSGVGRFSSAGVALLLNWLRVCETQNKSLRLQNIPDDMQAIIDVCDLEGVFVPLTGK